MRFLTLAAVLGAALSASAFGPKNHPDDQIRLFWGAKTAFYDDYIAMGFNTLMHGDGGLYNFEKHTLKPDGAAFYTNAVRRLADFENVGMCHYIAIQAGKAGPKRGWLHNRFPTIKKDGSRYTRAYDLMNPECRAEMRRAACDIFDAMPVDDPSYMMVQPSSEVRDRVEPSFTAVLTNAYRAASGRDVPELATGRYAPDWRRIEDFPPSRVIPDDYPLFDFYRWFWREGDGWNWFQTEVTREIARRTGGRVFTYYDPAVRVPPVWGSGGEVTFISHWMTCCPEPYRISYLVSEENAMARGRPGQGVAVMVQCITYRSVIAPKNAEPPGGADWAREVPDAQFLTLPHDMMREAMWTAYSRRVDGIFHYGSGIILEEPGSKRNPAGYWVGDAETKNVIRELHGAVGVPLGPLFRAAPERAPEVAVLESAASAIFAGRGSWGWGGPWFSAGIVATAANLTPAVIYEEEVVRDGLPPSLKVLMMPGCDVLPEGVHRRIAEWQAKGGVVAADGTCVPGLLPDLELPKFRRVKKGLEDYAAVRSDAEELRGKLKPFVEPYADTSSRDIIAHARCAGEADLVFAVNDRREAGDYVGGWGAVLEKGLPAEGAVTVRRAAGAVYDLVGHCAAEFAVRGGATEIPVRLGPCGGAVFLVTRRPLAPLAIAVEGTAVTVTTPDRDVMIPIRVSVPGAKTPRTGVVKDGIWKHDFKRPLADAEVFNLASGQTARTAK